VVEDVLVSPGISLILSIDSALFRVSEPRLNSFVFDVIYGSINLIGKKKITINIFVNMIILKVEKFKKHASKA
jgi:hypothetical protein